MRIAYILTWNLRHNDGVTRKVMRQAEAWRSMGHEVEVFCASETEGDPSVQARIFKRGNIWGNPLVALANRRVYADLSKAVREFAPDVVYFRWEYHKGALAKLMKEIPTAIELNTINSGEIRRRASGSWIGRVRYWYYLMTHKQFDRNCAGWVAVSKEILEKEGYAKFNKPMTYIPNSIPLDEMAEPVPYRPAEQADPIPRLVFISSSLRQWHGYGELVKLAEATVGELEFDLITGYELDPSTLPPNVRFHSFLEREAFLKVFEGAVCGIGSAAMFENGMEEGSILKTREYLACGLPVVLPYEDTAFVGRELPDWALRTPNRKDGLLDSKAEIIEFVQQMAGRRLQKEEVAPFIDSKIWEQRRMEFLEDQIAKSPAVAAGKD